MNMALVSLTVLLFALLCTAIRLLCGPFEVKAWIRKILKKDVPEEKKKLREEVRLASGLRARDKFRGVLSKTREKLTAYGHPGLYRIFLIASGALSVLGALAPFWFGMPIMSPALAILGACVPYWFVQARLRRADADVTAQLESAMGLVTVAFARTGSLEGAVRETVPSLRGYVKKAYPLIFPSTEVCIRIFLPPPNTL